MYTSDSIRTFLVAVALAACLPLAGPVRAADASAAGGPRPLLDVMKQMDADMQKLFVQMQNKDFGGAEKSARAIMDPGAVRKKDIDRVKKILGAEYDTYRRADDETYGLALEIAGAARVRNLERVSLLYMRLKSSCVGCHERFSPRLATKKK